jgi:hypothetical protein
MNFSETMSKLFPSTSTIWTAVGAGAVTIAVGFGLGGWKTGGAAERMASEAATDARVELASGICVSNFAATPAAFQQREEMLALPTFRQRSFVQEQPWALLPGETSVDRAVAERCAQRIGELEPEGLAALEETDETPMEPEVDPG